MANKANTAGKWRRRRFWLLVACSPLLFAFLGFSLVMIFDAWLRPLQLPETDEDLPSLVRKVSTATSQSTNAARRKGMPPLVSTGELQTKNPNQAMIDELVQGSEKWSTSLLDQRDTIRAAIDQMLSSMTAYSASADQLAPSAAFDRLVQLENQFNEFITVLGKASGKPYWACTPKNGGETWMHVQQLYTRWLAREFWKISMRFPQVSNPAAEYIERQLQWAQTAHQMAAGGIRREWPNSREFNNEWGDELRDMQINCLRRAGGWRNALRSLKVRIDKEKYNFQTTLNKIFMPPYDQFARDSRNSPKWREAYEADDIETKPPH